MRPVIVVSQCLGLDNCRYNGVPIEAPFIEELAAFVKIVPVCPEIGIGLPVPRYPIRIVQSEGLRLIQPDTGRDLTQSMEDFCRIFIKQQKQIDGFIYKSRSPSCGVGDTKLFSSATAKESIDIGSGFFARALLEKYPDLPIASERSMLEAEARQRFLQQVFQLAMRQRYIDLPSL